MEWLNPVISAVGLVIVAVIEGVAARERKAAKQDKDRAERRAALRERESRLSMEMMSATCNLAIVTAKKVNGMHTNGDVEEAMEAAGAAQDAYRSFLQDTASRQVAKQ